VPDRLPSLSHDPPTLATIDLAALAHNLTVARQSIPSSCEILAVVKADAYGHGAVTVSKRLAQLGVARFGVATIQEGVTLREAGIQAPILVMGAVFPDQLPDLLAAGLTPVVHDPAIADRLAALARSRPEPYPVHIKVDTGMGRLGLAPDQVLPLLQSPWLKGPLKAEALMTHLADADSPDPDYTRTQIARFQSVVGQIEAAGLAVPFLHAANSAAILRYPSAHFNMVRPGLMLYGYQSSPDATVLSNPADHKQTLLRPVLTLSARVVQVRNLGQGESISYNRTYRTSRPSRIAVLPIGYADGYSRLLSNRGQVLIKGSRAGIVGRVCMDMTMVDVTSLPTVATGDEAVLIGRQGDEQISAAEVAAWTGTIPYEVLCAIGPRVPRVYR
jgi:alanine racemase